MAARGICKVAAVVAVGLAAQAFVGCGGSEGELGDPMATWVCDNCGHEAKFKLEDKSPDCPKCDKGQMVQRVFYRCERCKKEIFEAYQQNWSPFAERGADCRQEADAQAPLPQGIPKDQAALVRRPGGKWVWADGPAGRQVMRKLSCPKCGAGTYEQFTRILDPDNP